MRILVVSQMYPGPDAPDLGIFVADLCGELERRGHDLRYAVIDRRGGSHAKYGRLLADAVREARRFRPQVVHGHFLFPAGAGGAPPPRGGGGGAGGGRRAAPRGPPPSPARAGGGGRGRVGGPRGPSRVAR